MPSLYLIAFFETIPSMNNIPNKLKPALKGLAVGAITAGVISFAISFMYFRTNRGRFPENDQEIYSFIILLTGSIATLGAVIGASLNLWRHLPKNSSLHLRILFSAASFGLAATIYNLLTSFFFWDSDTDLLNLNFAIEITISIFMWIIIGAVIGGILSTIPTTKKRG